MSNNNVMVFTDTNVIKSGMPVVLVIPGAVISVKGGRVQVMDDHRTILNVDPRYVHLLPAGTTYSTPPKERISKDKAGGWLCLCHNVDTSAGFYACDSQGNEVEPLVNSGWKGLKVCANCGRIIDQNTLEVVGRNPKPRFLL